MLEKTYEISTANDVLDTKEIRDNLVVQLKQSFSLVNYGDDQPFYKADNQDESQAVVDAVYTDEQREEKLSNASKDVKGRPVRYYREIRISHLLDIIENGEESPIDYHDESIHPSEKELRALSGFVLSIRDKEADLYQPIEDLLTIIFPNADPKAINKLLLSEEFNWEEALFFIQKHLSEKELKIIHSVARSGGENIIQFSPYMSSCPGGPRFYPPLNTAVIIEMVIPDDEVTINETNKTLAEREALVKKVKRSYISKIIFSKKAFYNQIICNPSTPVGEFVTSKLEKGEGINNAHSQWFREVPINETIPSALIQ